MEDVRKSTAMAQQQQQLMLQQLQRQKGRYVPPTSISDHSIIVSFTNALLTLLQVQIRTQILQLVTLILQNHSCSNSHNITRLLSSWLIRMRGVCHPDFKRPFSSLEDACERLLPYHVVADYEAEEDDKILDSAPTTGQILSRSQQWDQNIAAKVAEFTATFEKQVLAFNIIPRKRGLGEFRTEEKLMMEQLLLQEEKRSLFELRAEMDSRQKASLEENMRMAAMAHVEQVRAELQTRAEMMARAPIRANTLGSRMGELEQDFQQDDIINGWNGGNTHKDDNKEPSEDFLNDDEAGNGDAAMQSEWPVGGELDLNTRTR